MKEFSEIRRQQFLYEELYDAAGEGLDSYEKGYQEVYLPQCNEQDKLDLFHVAKLDSRFENALDRLSLAYTAGKPIEEVKALYPAAVDAFEAWCEADDNWYFYRHPDKKGKPVNSPVELDVHTSYVQLLRLLSLGVLFNRGDLLRKIAKRIAVQRGEDLIIEELLECFVPDPVPDCGYEHPDLYDHLINSAWEPDKAKSTACMQKFLKSWYKFYEGAPWHNAHLRVGENEDSPHWANYYGYWAWEAGALAYLYELDDTDYKDNLLYPKDLVAWARKQGKPPKAYTESSSTQATPSAEPASICTLAGTWYAIHDRMREITLKVGDTFPAQKDGPTGGITWYWKHA
jgi:Domain of unknown function (DUF1911)/Domain of unknown function (DUF1910)